MSSRNGDFVASRSDSLAWFDGPTILDAIDGLKKAAPASQLPLRMPIQDVYKFNERGDDRRIITGRVEAGTLRVGDQVIFSPSNKTSTISSIEAFSAPTATSIQAGRSAGITLSEQIYVSRGEVMSHPDAVPKVSTKLRANIFWLGRKPMTVGQRYKLKLATATTEVTIDTIHRVLDANMVGKTGEEKSIQRHGVAEVTLRTRHAIAADVAAEIPTCGRFVIVDEYDIAGGGILREILPDDQQQLRLESRIRDLAWVRSDITPAKRADLKGHPASMVMVTGTAGMGKAVIARALEAALVENSHHAYLLDGRNLVLGVDADIAFDDIDELVRRFGEVAHLLLDAGNLVVSTTNVIGLSDHREIATLISPFKMFVVHVGPEAEGTPEGADLRLDPNPNIEDALGRIIAELGRRKRIKTQA